MQSAKQKSEYYLIKRKRRLKFELYIALKKKILKTKIVDGLRKSNTQLLVYCVKCMCSNLLVLNYQVAIYLKNEF